MLHIILMSISCYVFFFAIDLLLFILYLFQTTEIILTKRNSSYFIIAIQNGSYSSGNHSQHQQPGPGTANKRTVQYWLNKFSKEMRALKMRSAGQPSEVDNNQFRAIIDADPLTTARDVAVELNINHSTVIQHLKQIGKRKISGCLVN